MSKQIKHGLDTLQQGILAMSAMVEEMIDNAYRALQQQDPELAAEVIQADEEVNKREVQIENQCLEILARQQPVAADLRRTVTVLKINNDLERIADLAVNIAERVQSLSQLDRIPVLEILRQMADTAIEMVRMALDAFVNLDVDIARKVCLRDDEVDDANRQVIDRLRGVMQTDSSAIEAALHYFSASRHIERMADHATNIAEDVIYLVQGEIARHRDDETMMTRLESM